MIQLAPGKTPAAELRTIYQATFQGALKRSFDIVTAVAGLLILSPVFLIVAVLIKLDSPGPVFFKQIRVGRQRRRFLMWKFRKMHNLLPDQGPCLTRRYDGRLTAIGRILERTKLDELPQLINVLRGDMSVVGPRPEVPRFLDTYPAQWDVVLSVKPGIFGPCQLRFRNESELYPAECDDVEDYYANKILPTKLAIDMDYARRHHLTWDIVCIVRSVWVSLFGAITRQTMINRRFQIINFLVLSGSGVGATLATGWLLGYRLDSPWVLHLTCLALLMKPLCLLAFKIPKALATSVTADDLMRLCWCVVTSGSLITCGMLLLGDRDVGRLALVLDSMAFGVLLVGYKLAGYNLYVTFVVQRSRALSRWLILSALVIGPASLVTVLTVRYGARNWTSEGGGLASLTLVVLAAVIRPGMILFKPVLSRQTTRRWLLREWHRLLFGAFVGSAVLIGGAVLFNIRGVGRMDIAMDSVLYLSLMTALAVRANRRLAREDVPERPALHPEKKERILVIGTGLELTAYISAMSALPEQHFEIVGIIMPYRQHRTNTVGGFPVLGCIGDAAETVKHQAVKKVIVVGAAIDGVIVERMRLRCNLRKDQILHVDLLGPLLREWRTDSKESNLVGSPNQAAVL